MNRRAPVVAIALTLLLGAAAPAIADPPAHAPAHGYRAKHQYVYYREREIYYEPARGIWFWIEDGDWRFGVKLPSYYQQFTSGGVTIELDSDKPYTEHRDVVERYGKGSRSKGKGKGKDSNKH